MKTALEMGSPTATERRAQRAKLRSLAISSLIVLGLLSCNSAAYATTATATFTVTITITSQCTISTPTNMAFGSTGLLSANVNATSTFSVTCTNGTTYTVGLDSGQNASGSQRRMKGGTSNSEYINYNLYSVAYSTAWGNVSGSWVSGTGNGAAQTLTVYGQVPPQTTPSASSNYTDTVTITITY